MHPNWRNAAWLALWLTPTSGWAQTRDQLGPQLGIAGALGMIGFIALLVAVIVLYHTVFDRHRPGEKPREERQK